MYQFLQRKKVLYSIITSVVITLIIVSTVIFVHFSQKTSTDQKNTQTSSIIKEHADIVTYLLNNPQQTTAVVNEFISLMESQDIRELVRNGSISPHTFEELIHITFDESKKPNASSHIKDFVTHNFFDFRETSAESEDDNTKIGIFPSIQAYAQSSCFDPDASYFRTAGVCYQEFEFQHTSSSARPSRINIADSFPEREGFATIIEDIIIRDILPRYKDLGWEIDSEDTISIFVRDTLYGEGDSSVTQEDRDETAATAYYDTEYKRCSIDIYPTITWDVLVDPIGMNESFAFVIAHEFYHCFQFKYYPDQMKVDYVFNNWWTEGSAEFGANLVYPSTELENQFNDQMVSKHETHPIFDLNYSNYLFFQSIHNSDGFESIKNTMSNMATENGIDKQKQALSSLPNIEKHFLLYQQNLIAQTHKDTSGPFKNILLSGLNREPDIVFFEDEIEYNSNPFVLSTGRIHIYPSAISRTARIETMNGEGRLSFYNESSKLWSDYPNIPMTETCESSLFVPSTYRIAITNTTSGNENYKSKLIISDDSDESNSPRPIDPQIVGKWTPNRDSYVEYLKKLYETNPIVLSEIQAFNSTNEDKIFSVDSEVLDYNAQVCFLNDGTLIGNSFVTLRTSLTGFSTEFGNATGSYTYSTKGITRAKYETTDGNLTIFDQEHYSFDSRMSIEVPVIGYSRSISIEDSTRLETDSHSHPYSITNNTIQTTLSAYGFEQIFLANKEEV